MNKPFLFLVVVLLLTGLACNNLTADQAAATAQALNNAANTQSVEFHQTNIAPVEVTALEEVDDFLNGTETPIPTSAPLVFEPTSTAVPVSASATICGVDNSATVNNKLIKITKIGSDNSITIEINGIQQDPIADGTSKWLGGIFIQNQGGCAVASGT